MDNASQARPRKLVLEILARYKVADIVQQQVKDYYKAIFRRFIIGLQTRKRAKDGKGHYNRLYIVGYCVFSCNEPDNEIS